MVICYEGNVHVGKSTLIKEFLKTNSNYTFIEESIFNPLLSPYNRQLDYIEQECEKIKRLKENTILDRSILSVFVYTCLTDTLSKKEKEKLIALIKQKIENKEIIIPDKLYLVVRPYEVVKENQLKLKQIKNTQEAIALEKYFNSYNNFFLKYSINKTSNLDQDIYEIDTKIYKNLDFFGF